MTIRAKILAGYVITLSIGFYLLFNWLVGDLQPRYREATEEPLVDTANLLAGMLGQTYHDGRFLFDPFEKALRQAQHKSLHAQIFGFTKTYIDLQSYVTDAHGVVQYDSQHPEAVGTSYAQWNDVARTLKGEYGARSTHDPESAESILYVAAPIEVEGQLVGVLSVAKPTHNSKQFFERAKWHLVAAAAITLLGMLLVGNIIAWLVTRPIAKLTAYVRKVKEGQTVDPPTLPRGEMENLKNAFNELRETLEGRRYIESYVQTVTHEIKSPLSGIRGAAELLKENPPPSDQARFLENILREVSRVQTLIDKLLQLSSLEAKRGLAKLEAVSVRALFEELRMEYEPLVSQKKIRLTTEGRLNPTFLGDSFWVKEALSNLLQNALEFTPESGRISLTAQERKGAVVLTATNSGSSIPEYASTKIFDPFYSLQRPQSGRKSSGLGLTIVRQIVELHGGDVVAKNITPDGVEVALTFPKDPHARNWWQRLFSRWSSNAASVNASK